MFNEHDHCKSVIAHTHTIELDRCCLFISIQMFTNYNRISFLDYQVNQITNVKIDHSKGCNYW